MDEIDHISKTSGHFSDDDILDEFSEAQKLRNVFLRTQRKPSILMHLVIQQEGWMTSFNILWKLGTNHWQYFFFFYDTCATNLIVVVQWNFLTQVRSGQILQAEISIKVTSRKEPTQSEKCLGYVLIGLQICRNPNLKVFCNSRQKMDFLPSTKSWSVKVLQILTSFYN